MEVFEDRFDDGENYKAGWMTGILDEILKIKGEVEDKEEKDDVAGELLILNLHSGVEGRVSKLFGGAIN